MESEQESGCSDFTLIEEGMAAFTLREVGMAWMGIVALSRSDLIVLTASSTSTSPSVRIPSRIVSRVMPFSGIMVMGKWGSGCD